MVSNKVLALISTYGLRLLIAPRCSDFDLIPIKKYRQARIRLPRPLRILQAWSSCHLVARSLGLEYRDDSHST